MTRTERFTSKPKALYDVCNNYILDAYTNRTLDEAINDPKYFWTYTHSVNHEFALLGFHKKYKELHYAIADEGLDGISLPSGYLRTPEFPEFDGLEI